MLFVDLFCWHYVLYLIKFILKLVAKTERDRLAVKEQINYENEEHQLIQSIRHEEKQKVLKELHTWKSEPVIQHNQSMKNNVMFKIFMLLIIFNELKCKSTGIDNYTFTLVDSSKLSAISNNC